MNKSLIIDSNTLPEFDMSYICAAQNEPPDCKLFYKKDVFKAHTKILSRFSIFFENAFTSGLLEDKKREVQIVFNPNNLFSIIFDWFYSGKMEIPYFQLMSVFSISRFYGIEILSNFLEKYLIEIINSSTIILFIQQCYENEIPLELKFLIPFIAKFLPILNIRTLSENLDVPVFCEILDDSNLNEESIESKMKMLTDFLGDYKCNDIDNDAIRKLFDPNDILVKTAYQQIQPEWAPKGFF